MIGNLIWVAVMVAGCTAAWCAPHQFAPVAVLWAWVFGTWWGYLTAYGEKP